MTEPIYRAEDDAIRCACGRWHSGYNYSDRPTSTCEVCNPPLISTSYGGGKVRPASPSVQPETASELNAVDELELDRLIEEYGLSEFAYESVWRDPNVSMVAAVAEKERRDKKREALRDFVIRRTRSGLPHGDSK